MLWGSSPEKSKRKLMEHLEGRKSVLAALAARQRKIEVVLVNQTAHEEKIQDVLDAAGALGVPVKRVASKELDAMAHGATHGGVLAVCSPKPLTSEADLLEMVDRLASPPMLLLLEGVEDARNLGFTLRSAEALGAAAVLIKKHVWDFDSVEVARPASGAYERMPLVKFENTELIEKLRARGMRLIGCIAETKRTIYDTDLTGGIILAIGGEKRGLSGAVRGLCDCVASIPTAAGAASLPLSHAAAIVLAEARRQRGKMV
jgi:23S rRNA (guanosine2251-2'-O)-methyltransferase